MGSVGLLVSVDDGRSHWDSCFGGMLVSEDGFNVVVSYGY